MELNVSLYRYNPEQDKFPYMKSYKVKKPEKDIMVLDLLNMLKEDDATISYRRSCREGVCGSDGMNINGKNGLACITPLSEVLKGNKLELRPLPGLPVIRDLIVDMTQFYEQYEKIKPFLQSDSEPPEQERLQSPQDRDKLDGLYECILCACCSTSCPSFWWNPDKFVGQQIYQGSTKRMDNLLNNMHKEYIRIDHLIYPYLEEIEVFPAQEVLSQTARKV